MLDPFALKWIAGFFIFLLICHRLFPRFLFQIPLLYVLAYHFPGIFRLSIDEGPDSSPAGRGLELAGHQAFDIRLLVVVNLSSAWLTWELWQIWELGVVKKLCQCVLSSDACQTLAWMFGRCMLQRKCSRPSRLPQHTETSQALQSSSQEMKDVQIFSRFP